MSQGGCGREPSAPTSRTRWNRRAASRKEGRAARSILLLFTLCVAAPSPAGAEAANGSTPIAVRLPGIERVDLSRTADDRFVYTVVTADGRALHLDPDAFAALVHGRIDERPGWQRFLNISGPVGLAWVALGLFGQLAFTARLLVQWWASEREKRSVVPVAFWWMSIGGATMLLVYFVWRKDVVGVLGQSAGFFIYARNLWLIRRGRVSGIVA